MTRLIQAIAAIALLLALAACGDHDASGDEVCDPSRHTVAQCREINKNNGWTS